MKTFLLFFLALTIESAGQNPSGIEIQTSGTKASLRGLSVVNDTVAWASGSNGTVAKTVTGGKGWKWLTVKGFEKNDFRDIEAFDENTAIIMSVGEPAFILKTTDGGDNWKVVYRNETKGMFLDAMEFSSPTSGTVIGDPVQGKFFMAFTTDGGNTWQETLLEKRPVADSGEACFAASGTNIRNWSRKKSIFVSGGKSSHLLFETQKIKLPIIQGKETTGANSLALRDRFFGKKIIVVGGDFSADTSSKDNCFYSTNKGKTWNAPRTAPHGYRSCVEYIGRRKWITCGTKGVDLSSDDGNNWQLISTEGFHVCRKAKNGNAVYLAGPNGKIGRLKM